MHSDERRREEAPRQPYIRSKYRPSAFVDDASIVRSFVCVYCVKGAKSEKEEFWKQVAAAAAQQPYGGGRQDIRPVADTRQVDREKEERAKGVNKWQRLAAAIAAIAAATTTCRAAVKDGQLALAS